MARRWARAVLAIAATLTGCVVHRAVDLIVDGSARHLRDRPAGARPASFDAPPLLVLAFDGVSRDLLYDMLRRGELPELAALLGGDGFAHAHFDETLVSTLPSTTMPAWVTAFTGLTPAEHGVTNNEYFVRETRRFECPATVSFADLAPTLAIYTDDALDRRVDGRTVYERLRDRDPDALIWVAANQVYRGGDVLMISGRTILLDALQAIAQDQLTLDRRPKPTKWAALDRSVVNAVTTHLAHGPLPDVLTVYLSGADEWAHVAVEGPDRARHDYLRDVIDPTVGRLRAALERRGALAGRWVVVTADHGHTAVVADDRHGLVTGKGGLPVVLEQAGFRVRPAAETVDARDPFSAVIANGGAVAYVYLADRSRCPGPHDVCDWRAPPRYREDVLAAADAIFHNDADGRAAPRLRGAIDLILTRRPRPYAEVDAPFEVYVGGGQTMPIDDYLAAHPHPTYVELAARLRDLGVGRHGERAGDIMLIAHNGDRERAEDRFFFAASTYRSWHGSPSRRDSEIPLIVANSRVRREVIAPWVQRVLGARPAQQRITPLLLGLRGPDGPR